mmetsp:Transcript_5348/g.17313  ORF Transcript_5348/g.17313 Transcript_5348/m.17313 type:complete len:262 (-) Transcript_5348:14-799(-)
MGTAPPRERVGRKARMDQSHVRLEVRVIQIAEVLQDLLRLEHTLVSDGTAGQRNEIKVLLLQLLHADQEGLASDHVQNLLKLSRRHSFTSANEDLLHVRLASGSGRTEALAVVGANGKLAPHKELLLVGSDRILNSFLSDLDGLLILREEDNADGIQTLGRKVNGLLGSNLPHEEIRHTEKHTRTITSFGLTTTCSSVSKMVKDVGGVDHSLVRRLAGQVRNETNTAGILLESRVIQPLLRREFIVKHRHFSLRMLWGGYL